MSLLFKANQNENDSSPSVENDMRDVQVESEEELGDVAAIAAKIKKLKTELESCKSERNQYLDGWQRCKADSVNVRRDALLMAERIANRSRDSLIDDIIPALDSFDMAILSEAWASFEPNWRAGMENVRTQLTTALSNQGITSFANAGEKFDPTMHETIKEIDTHESPGTIVQVVRKGYQSKDGVIRPAQVVVVADRSE